MPSRPGRFLTAVLCVSAASCAAAAAQQAVPPAPPSRPPYRILAVTVMAGASSLPGTLTVPEGPGPFPAVVLLPGRAASDDATIADELTRRGIVVHRQNNPTAADTVGDALAVVTHLTGMPTIDSRRIGVAGQAVRESAVVRTASQSATVAFVVILGSPGSAESPIRRLVIPRLEAPGTMSLAEVSDWILKTPPRW